MWDRPSERRCGKPRGLQQQAGHPGATCDQVVHFVAHSNTFRAHENLGRAEQTVRTHAQVHPPRSANMLADGRSPRSIASAMHPFDLGISGFSYLFIVVQSITVMRSVRCFITHLTRVSSKWGANPPIL